MDAVDVIRYLRENPKFFEDYADEIAADDVVFDHDGVNVIVDRESLKLIDGTEIDFVKQGLNEAFKFRNPNVRGECGCGESFSV
jgi:iron-sulfur cluster assembly protein